MWPSSEATNSNLLVTRVDTRECGTRGQWNCVYRGPGPTFGQDNETLLRDLLGLDDATYQGLVQDTITTTKPTSGEASPQMEPSRAVEMGLLAAYEPDYRERLGLE